MRDENAVADNATEVTRTEETSDNSTTTNNNNGSRKRRKSNKASNKKRGRQTKEKSVVPDDPIQLIKARFAACGRCCYFLGSYTSAHGDEELKTAVQDGLTDWLTLTWDQHTRNLVHKAFGVRLDVDYYHYEGCCVACCRQFVYEVSQGDEVVFRIQL